MKKYVIIGNSAAGLTAAKKLRDLDPASEIVCISKEKERLYNKCKLANYLAGDVQMQDVFVGAKKELEEKKITLILGRRVERILSDNNEILLASEDEDTLKEKKQEKEKISYDRLFIATGARPLMPNIAGVRERVNGVFTFHTLQDANSILEFIERNKPKNAVVIGAGMTGIECADALAKKGLQVSIVERGSHVLAHCCDKAGAEYIEKLMEARGVTVLRNETVQEIISEDDRVSCVALNSGKFVLADMVIFAVGVKPNIDLAKEAGVKIGDFGIITDEYMKTSIKNIYSGGDAAQVKDFVNGQDMRSCTWPDACMQGMVAAQSMAGEPVAYNGALPFAVSRFLGIDFASYLTSFCHKAKYENVVSFGDGFFYKILLEDGFVKGFLLIGDIRPLGMLRKAILGKQKFDIKRLKV
ncbi:NAD(P)/FAD-dependent oxidoreductase [Candidatus Dependentiae bacterium]